VILDYRRNKAGTVQAAYSGAVRVGYIECSDERRWLWSLNVIRAGGGRDSGIVESEPLAKDAMKRHWTAWLDAAGLALKEHVE
jgi:hypothetical protein